ncbi:MAG TPA: response regulator [Acidobacteriaceae bacterium]
MKDVPTETSFPSQENRRPLVLVVDDERVIADTLSVILSKNGFEVITAYTGEQALSMALETKPDLLLSDVMMGPGIDGTELAVEIVRTYPGCKVLLFSGHSATRELLGKAREAGHDFTLLAKPLHPADLLARLSETFTGQLTV